jgi:hypothetical protein
MTEIYKHRVYRELSTTAKMTSDNIVRYYGSWFEELDQEEKEMETKYKQDYN